MNTKHYIQKIKVILFDADNTLWKTLSGEYISRIPSKLKLINDYTIIRSADGMKFVLDKEILLYLKVLAKKGILMGLVSDNHEDTVWKALTLFKINKYFSKECSNIRLFKGSAPKIKMIFEILEGLEKQKLKICPKEVLFIDDKNYSQEANNAGMLFIHLKNNNIIKTVQFVLKKWIDR